MTRGAESCRKSRCSWPEMAIEDGRKIHPATIGSPGFFEVFATTGWSGPRVLSLHAAEIRTSHGVRGCDFRKIGDVPGMCFGDLGFITFHEKIHKKPSGHPTWQWKMDNSFLDFWASHVWVADGIKCAQMLSEAIKCYWYQNGIFGLLDCILWSVSASNPVEPFSDRVNAVEIGDRAGWQLNSHPASEHVKTYQYHWTSRNVVMLIRD